MSQKSVKQLLKEKAIFQVIDKRLVQGEWGMSVDEAIKTMQEHGSGYVVLVKDKKPIGIFTENDVLYKVLERNINGGSPVSEFMTKDPCVLSPDDSVGDAIDLMGKHRFYHIPLVDREDALVGILSVRSLIRFLAAFYPTEIYNLPPDLDQIIETVEGG